ncbi:response regulator [bacterium]|nr:response regulator [bacterium]
MTRFEYLATAHRMRIMRVTALGLALAGTLGPIVLAAVGVCFNPGLPGGGDLPFLSLRIGGGTVFADINTMSTILMAGAMGFILCRFLQCRFVLILGTALIMMGIAAGTFYVPAMPAGASGPAAIAGAMALGRATSAVLLLLGAVLFRWGPADRIRAWGWFLAAGTAGLATLVWAWTQGVGPAMSGSHLVSAVTLGSLLAMVLIVTLGRVPVRNEGFRLGVLAAAIPLAAGQWFLTHPLSVEGHGLHAAVMTQWAACFLPAVGVGVDLARLFFLRGRTGEQGFLRAVIDAIPHFIFARDADGVITLCNQAVADYYGMSVDEVEGRLLTEVHPDPGQAREFLEEDRITLDRGTAWWLPVARMAGAGGANLHVTAVKTPLDPFGNGRRQVLGVSIDVTDRVQAEEALADRLVFERTAASILDTFMRCNEDTLPDAMDVALAQAASFAQADRGMLYRFQQETGDADLLFAWRAPSARAAGPAAGRIAAADLLWADHMFANKLFLTAARRDDLPPDGHALWDDLGVSRDGALLAVPVHLDNALFGFLAVAADERRDWRHEDTGLLRSVADLFITVFAKLQTEQSLRAAMAAAQQSSKAKGDFLANMSHEIRTPLNCIIGITDLLAEMAPSPGQSQYLEMIRQSGSNLLNLINDILDLSKIEAGQLELDPLETPLRRLVDEIAGLAAFTAQAKGLEMICRLTPGCPEQAILDPVRLRQVLTNLLNNATKFTSEGHVFLNVEPVGEHDGRLALRFEVSDTGIGIAESKLDKIFEKFTQADASTTRRFGGTGLGLSISQQLVGLMGGKITVESAPGRGSTFSFTIPVQVVEPAPAAVLEPAGGARAVLVVTGHRLSGEVLAEQVRQLGHQCRVAVGLDEARAVLDPPPGGDRPPLHFILLDQSVARQEVPVVNRHLEGLDPQVRPQVILLTNLSSLQRERDLQGLGFSGMLNKPVNPRQLAAVLDGVPRRAQGEVAYDPAMSPAPIFTPGGPQSGESFPDANSGPETAPLVLVAEDNPFNQKVAAGMLKLLGCRVKVAANGVEAVAMVQAEDFAVVFMDCQMPSLDGYEATRRIRALDGPRSRIPVIAMTANVMSGDREACFQAGMDDFLSKPINKAVLSEMLEKWQVTEPVTAG